MISYSTFVSGILFPLHERLKGHDTVARLRALEASQWWTPEQLETYRVEKLRSFLDIIGRSVPFYRKAFAVLDFRSDELRSLAELSHYPLLTKELIRANVEALKSERERPLKRYNTGGSSGEPLVFFMGKDRISHDVAAKWRATRWWGVDIGDREVVVWGSPIEIHSQDRLRSLRDLLFRSELLSAFEMSEANLDKFMTRIRECRPAMLFGYPSSLSFIAAHARRRGRRMNDLGIRVAFVTSETLFDHQRDLIEGVFGCRVANGYGGRDAGFIAHQCPANKMHISAEDIIVEIVDSTGRSRPPGLEGEIVVTHLGTSDFPFLRYRTGDVGALDPEPCSCGRGLPVLREVQGRTSDFVVAADGTVMHGLALIYVLRDLPGIERFKIVQESREYTRVQIVPGYGFDPKVEAAIRDGLRARLGRQVRIEIESVAEIPPESSGKFRYVISRETVMT